MGLPFETWRTQGRRLAAALAAAPWAIGDWLVEGERAYGQDQVWSVVDELKMDYATLRNYQRVAEAFPPSFPRESYPWSWWRESATLPRDTALRCLQEAQVAGEGRSGVVARRKEIEGVSAPVAPRRWTANELRGRLASWHGPVALRNHGRRFAEAFIEWLDEGS